MRKFTRKEIREAAAEGEGFCRRCGAQGAIEREEEDQEGLLLPCEVCGAVGMMDAAGMLALIEMVEEED